MHHQADACLHSIKSGSFHNLQALPASAAALSMIPAAQATTSSPGRDGSATLVPPEPCTTPPNQLALIVLRNIQARKSPSITIMTSHCPALMLKESTQLTLSSSLCEWHQPKTEGPAKTAKPNVTRLQSHEYLSARTLQKNDKPTCYAPLTCRRRSVPH
jgi:hypothetical protein